MLSVRVILFDAVGTLICAEPSVAEVYHQLGSRFGSPLSVAQIQQRLHDAFRRQQELDAQRLWRTDENREYQRWQAIVHEVFRELGDTRALFQALWEHFARPDAWACFPEVADTLSRLAAHGYPLGIASNFDQRLRSIRAGLPALQPCRWLFISSQLGWLKPTRQFFHEVTQSLGVMPHEVLYVGDDYQNDCLAALQAGWQTVWLSRQPPADAYPFPDPTTAKTMSTHTRSYQDTLTSDQPACPMISSLDSLIPLLKGSSPNLVG